MKKVILFLVYILARLIKSPLFWIAISPFKRWILKPDYVNRDIKSIILISIFVISWYFFGVIWSSIITFVVLVLNIIFLLAHGLNIKNER